MSKIGNIAKKVVGMQTVKIDDIIEQFGGVVTINGLSYATYKGDQVPLFTFAEGAGMAFGGGSKKLSEFAQALEKEYGGDLEAINADLKVTGVKIKISPLAKTSSGKQYRPVTFLGEVNLSELETSDNELQVDAETGEVISNDDPPF